MREWGSGGVGEWGSRGVGEWGNGGVGEWGSEGVGEWGSGEWESESGGGGMVGERKCQLGILKLDLGQKGKEWRGGG